MVKNPGKNNFTPVHQDWTFVDEKNYASYTLWCPLVPVDFSTSTLGIIPKSHQFLPDEIRPSPCPTYLPPFMSYAPVLLKYLKYIPLAPGEALLFDHRTWHGAGPRNAKTPRIALGVVLAHQKAPLQHHYILPQKKQVAILKVDKKFILKYGPTSLLHIHEKGGIPNGYPIIHTYPFVQKSSDFQDILPKLPKENDALAEYFKDPSFKNPDEITEKPKPKITENTENTKKTEKRQWWKIYTPKNIILEILYRIRKYIRQSPPLTPKNTPENPAFSAKEVGEFYDKHHETFLDTYKDVIQAFRSKNTDTLLKMQMKNINIRPEDTVLDAGSGVAGPARYFANHEPKATFHAITISKKQHQYAEKKCQNIPNLYLHHGDYHHLSQYFPSQFFDKAYFLESLGHAHNKEQVLAETFRVLKQNGKIFIKDLFIRVAPKGISKEKIQNAIENINKNYCYQIPSLSNLLHIARKEGFILQALRIPSLPLEEFENLHISNLFQEKSAVNQIEHWSSYVFPVEFYEIELLKPPYLQQETTDQYHLQRLKKKNAIA